MTFPRAHRHLMHFAVLTMLVLSSTYVMRAGPGAGTLFGTDANAGHLLKVNTVTGAGTVVGSIGFPSPALAIDPTTGIVYVGRGAGMPNLYRVNPANGAATLVGNTGLGFAAIGGMDFSSSGALYAAVNLAGDGGTGSDHLALLNKATGVATVIGSFGTCTGVVIPTFGAGTCTIQGIEAIAFDASGTLWGAKDARASAGATGLYKINPATGKATFVSPILNASAVPPSGGVASLQFGCDGTLYGGTARAIGAAGDGGRLVTINPATGVFSFVGAVSATAGSSLGGLAFDHPCPVIDIKPGSFPNAINPRSNGLIPVAILSSARFNALVDVNVSSLTFGHTGNEASLAFCNLGGEDVNGDGLLDLVCHFETQLTGFQSGDTKGILKGLVFGSSPFVATDSVKIVP